MRIGGWFAIIVAIIGAASTFITAQFQETRRFEMLIEEEKGRLDRLLVEQKHTLQSQLILTAISTDDIGAAKENLRFFAEVGLLDDFEEQILTYLNNTAARTAEAREAGVETVVDVGPSLPAGNIASQLSLEANLEAIRRVTEAAQQRLPAERVR